MQILLSDVLTEVGKKKEYQAELGFSTWKSGAEAYPVTADGPIRLELVHTGEKKIEVSVICDLTLLMPCDRCLDPVVQKLHIEDTELVDMGMTEEERIAKLDEKPYINGLQLDVDSLVKTEIYVHMPMKVLCREDCKGICNRCGANLNRETCDCDASVPDPRMAAILDVFKAAEEKE